MIIGVSRSYSPRMQRALARYVHGSARTRGNYVGHDVAEDEQHDLESKPSTLRKVEQRCLHKAIGSDIFWTAWKGFGMVMEFLTRNLMNRTLTCQVNQGVKGSHSGALKHMELIVLVSSNWQYSSSSCHFFEKLSPTTVAMLNITHALIHYCTQFCSTCYTECFLGNINVVSKERAPVSNCQA